ncbi:MAG: hypothetical protein Q4B67_02275 [Eubacteriales bacterium]|nr:hypothetical protein [Eubacteriales bacterium]
MANLKDKKVLMNIATNVLYELVVLLFGLILPRLYLVNFGSEVNGLDSTIKNIFGYLGLLEVGIGLASQYALYGPASRNDQKSMSEILVATRNFYLRSGVFYTLITIAFATVYPIIIKTTLPYFTVFMLIMLYGIPGIILFLLRGKYTVFLEVMGKQYILTTLTMITFVFSNILRLIFLIFSSNLILIQATYCLPSIIQIIIVIFYVKKKYPWIDWKAKPDKEALSQKDSVLVHQISSCVFGNTDAIIISVINGMNYVSVYAVFSLFFKYIQKIIAAFTKSFTFKLGHSFQSDRDEFNRYFSLYETVYYALLFMVFTLVTAFLYPVIKLYTAGVSDAAIYDSTFLLVMFSITNLIEAIETPLNQLVGVSGIFSDTKKYAVWGMVINLAVTLLTAPWLGIAGCLTGTIVAMVYRLACLFRYTCKNVRSISTWSIYRKLLVNALLYAAVVILFMNFKCEARSYFYVAFKAILNALWICPLFVLVNVMIDRESAAALFASIKKIFVKAG